MKELLEFLISEITGSDSVEVSESREGNNVYLTVTAPSEIVGLIIGKEGKTIKNIRKLLAIRATQDNTIVNISVNS